MYRFQISALVAVVGCLGCPAAGCSPTQQASGDTADVPKPAIKVKLAHPAPRTIKRYVSAPGAIQPFERTEIYSKFPGFVRRWHVDLGDRVKKDQLMAELEVPELVEQINEVRASVQQVRDVVFQLEQLVIVAERNRDVASNAIAEAKGEIERYTAELTRRRSEHVRLKELLEARSISQRVVEEAEEHQHAAQATLRVAQLTVMTRETELLSAVASVGKAKADVRAAQSTVQVAGATVRRYEALLDYTKSTPVQWASYRTT